MKDEYAEKISALVDNEVDGRELPTLVDGLRDDEDARSRWARYHLVSDVLHNNLPNQVDFTFAQRVSAALDAEPTVLAPQRKSMQAILRHVAGFAVAATVAVVAVLVVQQQGVQGTGTVEFAATSPANQGDWVRVNASNVKWTTQQPAVESRLNAYLVNHNGYTNSVRGILPYAPIVSSSNEMPAQQDKQGEITGDNSQK